MKRIAAVLFVLATITLAQVKIREVRQNNSQGEPLLLDSVVTVTGVVPEMGHFGWGGPGFVRDSTGSIAMWGSPCNSLLIGDSITVSGTVNFFYGQTELKELSIKNHGSVGTPQPEPFELPGVDRIDTTAGYVETEGDFARFEKIWIAHSPGERFSGDQNYAIFDQNEYQGQIRIDKDAAELVGMTIPDDTISLVGIIGQYKPDPPHFGGYQIMPRMAADLGVPIQFMPIAEAIKDENGDRIPDRLGESVTITGIVTVPSGVFNTQYTDIYVQDSSAGVNVFAWDTMHLELGDSVMVSGQVDQYRGKTEVSSASITMLEPGRSVPKPRVLTCAEINSEPYEGELVKLVGVATTAFLLTGEKNYPVDDQTGSAMMRIDDDTEIPGLICVSDTFTLVGVKCQYAYDTINLNDGYQIMPRFRSDFSRTAEGLLLRTIAQVQKPGDDGVTPVFLDSLVRVHGRITGPASTFTIGSSKSCYIEDETQGINVYGCSYNSGDEHFLDSLGIEWEVIGKVTEYNGLTEVADGAMRVIDSNAVPVVPRPLPYNASLTEGMESDLVIVVGDVIEPAIKSGTGYNITIKNGTPGLTVRIGENTGIGVSWITRGRRIRVAGIVGQYDYEEPFSSGYQLMPRFNADVVDTSGAFPPSLRLVIDTITPNPFFSSQGQVATIQVNAPSDYRLTVTVFDMGGRVVRELLREGVGGFHDLKWDGTDNLSRPLPAGIYLVSLKGVPGSGGTESVVRPVVIAARFHN